jgi:hypothetical protein
VTRVLVRVRVSRLVCDCDCVCARRRIASERVHFGKAGGDYDWKASDPAKARKRLSELQSQQVWLEVLLGVAIVCLLRAE